MTQQPLFDIQAAHALTARQQHVHDALTRAAHDGLTTDEAGAVAHEIKDNWGHARDQRCRFCGQDGKQILEALKAKGLARYRRARGATPGVWLAVDLPAELPPGMTTEIPY